MKALGPGRRAVQIRGQPSPHKRMPRAPVPACYVRGKKESQSTRVRHQLQASDHSLLSLWLERCQGAPILLGESWAKDCEPPERRA